ncbi:ATP-binding protein [Maliponia aquimaris]|uniref:histidine kinase n=1 Tax=Maliponia aquimaris TaxID=1673631 RepID=A0A238L555_9RHOB|nr:ATP-binding protein [Maliponia aquimaris]SMX49951.1 Alkaline phosphatase synthesis sensor protein PhoR [Maliponia aquimaris]
MSTVNALAAISIAYVTLLFSVAFFAERAARGGRARWMRAPLVYTLSLSIYCTAWTFYGAVGSAARNGLEYLTIYLGPSLVMIGWWWILRKLVRIGRNQRITSIADLISSRYGKSNLLGIGVTFLAVVGATPYIALQLQSVTLSVEVFSRNDGTAAVNLSNTAFWVAVGLAVFTVIFGTRNLDANERHHGVVMAIAVEAVVKLFALLAVGGFVVWGLSGGVGATLARIDASPLGTWSVNNGRWAGLMFLSAAAFLCLPRMFQVLVVENDNDAQLRMAAWAFPLYLMLMSLFIVPIAVVGLDLLPQGSNPDLFVLTLPLSQGQEGLAVLAFLGGFSSATSMVIVAAIALSTMVSNHIVMPVWLRLRQGTASVSGDVRHVVLLSRRLSIAGVLLLGYLYYALSGGGTELAAIGLISFTGLAQVLPAMLGGIFWRGATRIGALAGLTVGFGIWMYTLYLPSFGLGTVLPASWFTDGPFGIMALRPEALFGISLDDRLLHAMFWSLLCNGLIFVIASLLSDASPLERLQGAQFVSAQQAGTGPRSWLQGTAQSEDLMVMTQRILGAEEAQALFLREARRQGVEGDLPAPTPDFLQVLERELAGSVGAATAHAMVGQIVGGAMVSVEDLMAVADETAQMMEYSARLEAQSQELSRTAAELRRANDKLTRLSVQKDAFLSQISHELRTPMSSIRAFSEILRDAQGLTRSEQNRYASIIHDEAMRLTRLLDDLLDLSVLENGQVSLNLAQGRLEDVLDRAVSAALADEAASGLRVRRRRVNEQVWLTTDVERLSQVFINLISNAQKYCDAEDKELEISVTEAHGQLLVDFIDNGSGVAPEAQDVIFEKFARVSDQKAGGAGLGLAISRQIVTRLGGEVSYLPDRGGAAFRVALPLRRELAAQ